MIHNYNSISLKKHVKTLTTIAAALVIGGTFARAEESTLPRLEEPTLASYPWTISIDGNFTHTGVVPKNGGPASNTYQLGGNFGFGRFVTQSIELGFSIGGLTSGDSSGFNNGSVNWLAKAKYHFAPTKALDPYLGLTGGATTDYNDGLWTTNPSFGGFAGLEYALSESGRTRLFVEYNFLYTPQSDIDTYQNLGKIGIIFRF